MEKEIKIKDKTYFFIEVPFDAHSFREKLIMDGAGLYVSYEPRIKPYSALQSVKISKDNKENYKIISTSKDITESEAKKIVENHIYPKNIITYRDYMFLHSSSDYEKELLFDYMYAKESLQSLIRANGLDVEKNYLILLKN